MKMYLHTNRWRPGRDGFDHQSHHSSAQYLQKGEYFRDMCAYFECVARVRENGSYTYLSKKIRDQTIEEGIEFLKHGTIPLKQNPRMRKWKRGEY